MLKTAASQTIWAAFLYIILVIDTAARRPGRGRELRERRPAVQGVGIWYALEPGRAISQDRPAGLASERGYAAGATG